MSRRTSVGLDRPVELDWLDATAGYVANGSSPDEVRKRLFALLDGVVSGQDAHSARGKTITVLSRIWSAVPEPALGLHARALAALPKVDPEERVAVHWAMVVSTHTFAYDVASTLGRLLGLHDNVTAAQVTQRLVNTWGDRTTIRRATPRLLRSMARWGTLVFTDRRGTYGAPTKRPASATSMALLLEALLINVEEGALPLQRATQHPALFPFSLGVTQLQGEEQFQVDRQGLDTDMVRLSGRNPVPRDSEQLRLI